MEIKENAAPKDVVFRPATMDDAFAIGDALRDGDKKESAFIWPELSPQEIVARCIGDTYASQGPCYTCVVEGVPACIFGIKITEMEPLRNGIIWLLCTDIPDKYPILFARYSKNMLDLLSKSLLPIKLENSVWIEHKSARAWLKWLGFTETDEYQDKNGVGWVHVEKFIGE